MSVFRRLAVTSLMLGVVPLLAGCSKDVQIGAVISESGAVAFYGEKVKKGIELALEQANAQSALESGGKLSIVYRDDTTNANRGVQVTRELIDEVGVKLIIGAISSDVTKAIAPICEKERVLLMSPSASAPELSDAGEYIYRNYPSDIREGTSMAKFAKDLGLERVAVIALNDSYGTGLSEVFTEQYESRFRQVVKTFLFDEGDTSSFPAIIAELNDELKPDGIYIVSYQNDLATLLIQLKAIGVQAVYFASSSVTPDIVRLAGSAADHLVYSQTTFDLDSSDPAVSSFVSAYREKYGEDPDIYAAHGFDALNLLIRAINANDSPHPDDVIIGLNGIHDYRGAAGLTTFDKNGDVIRHPRILLIHNGAAMPYEQYVSEGGSILAGN